MKIPALLLALAAPTLAGGLKWETTAQRFEVKPRDRTVHAEFTCKNTSRTPVKIESIRTGCICCTEAKAGKTTLAPGERTAVSVTVRIEQRRFPIAKSVTVKTDDGESTQLVVQLAESK